jgi:hypothetical protein
MKKPLAIPTPYGVGLAVAFALLAPAGGESKSAETPLIGVAESCADNCVIDPTYKCIHGVHKDEGYRDPE